MNIDLAPLGTLLERGDTIHAQHCIAGNRMRMKGPARLELHDAWTRMLPPRERRLVWLLTGWLMRRYGYRFTTGTWFRHS